MLVKFTSGSGHDVWINPAHVECVVPADDGPDKAPFTNIYMAGEAQSYYVVQGSAGGVVHALMSGDPVMDALARVETALWEIVRK